MQSQIEDLQYLSQQYEQQEAARMARASGAMDSADFYVNKPIPVQQRHREGAAQLRWGIWTAKAPIGFVYTRLSNIEKKKIHGTLELAFVESTIVKYIDTVL